MLPILPDRRLMEQKFMNENTSTYYLNVHRKDLGSGVAPRRLVLLQFGLGLAAIPARRWR
jgi:hypothetical protein